VLTHKEIDENAMKRVGVPSAKTDTEDFSKLHEESQPEAREARRDYGFAILCMQASRPVTQADLGSTQCVVAVPPCSHQVDESRHV